MLDIIINAISVSQGAQGKDVIWPEIIKTQKMCKHFLLQIPSLLLIFMQLQYYY